MATIEPRKSSNGSVSYRVKIRSKSKSQSKTFSKLSDARKWVNEIESSIAHTSAAPKDKTIGGMIDRFLCENPLNEVQMENKGVHLNRWKREIGDMSLAEVTPDIIGQIKIKLLSEKTHRKIKRSNGTVARYLASLSSVYTIAVNEWQWATDNPVRKVKKPKESRGRVRFLDDDERRRLLAECQKSKNPHLYICTVLALSTGMRYSELMNLTWRDVNMQKGFVILHQTKNGERRRIPLSRIALSLLSKHSKKSALLFPSSNDKTKHAELRTAFENALKRAYIEDFHWHDLRHSAASYLTMNGASLAEVAEILGHKTLQMVKRYSHLSDSHVSKVVSDMNDVIFKNLHE